MSALVVEGGRRLAGTIVAPPDKSITHRALLLAALGEGRTEVAPVGMGRDNQATLGALGALGVEVEREGRAVTVTGAGGPLGLRAPAGAVDCMNSGTTMRMLSGVIAASALRVRMEGDASLSRRPMSRLAPLELMGARLEGRSEGGRIFPPITVTGARALGVPLRGIDHELAVASAQVKSALILAGLWAEGETRVREPERSRDHTERMLRALGADVREGEDGAIVVRPLARPWRAPRLPVAPDLSSAAFLIGAALVTESPALVVETGVNPTRAGFLDVLARMGVRLERTFAGEIGGEPVERVRVEPSGRFTGTTIEGALALRAIDEIPLIAGLAAFAEGRTVIRDASELRVKESDRLAATHALLEAFGARSTETPDGLIIEGGRSSLRGCEVDGRGDHRIAMTAAVMGLGIAGATRVNGAEHIEVSFPGFREELERLGAAVYAVEPAEAE